MSDQPAPPLRRNPVFRDSMAVAATTGAYGISFGAIGLAGGLSLVQTMVLSLLMFSGGSQYGLVGVIAGGGSPWAGAATAVMLGARNMFYGLRLATLLRVRGWRRVLAAQVVIDESSAMSLGRENDRQARLGFYATGIGIYVLWNLGTLVGAIGASALGDPAVLGLDAAAPCAFLALLVPRLRGATQPGARRRGPSPAVTMALAAAALAVALTPVLPVGLPVLAAALFGIAVGAWPGRVRPDAAPDASVPVDGDAP